MEELTETQAESKKDSGYSIIKHGYIYKCLYFIGENFFLQKS